MRYNSTPPKVLRGYYCNPLNLVPPAKSEVRYFLGFRMPRLVQEVSLLPSFRSFSKFGDPNVTPKYYNPYYGHHRKASPSFGKPHFCSNSMSPGLGSRAFVSGYSSFRCQSLYRLGLLDFGVRCSRLKVQVRTWASGSKENLQGRTMSSPRTPSCLNSRLVDHVTMGHMSCSLNS